MADVIGQELGRSVTYRRLSVEAVASALRSRGASERAISDLTEAFAAQDEGIYDPDWATARPTATDLRTWCRDVLAPAAAGVR